MLTGVSSSIKLYDILKNIPELKEIVGDKIIPLDSKEEVTFPFVVYTRFKTEPAYTKDYLMYDNVYFEIVSVSKNYLEGIKIIEIIRNYLDCHHDNFIYHITIEDVTEDFVEYAYVQNMIIKAKIRPLKE